MNGRIKKINKRNSLSIIGHVRVGQKTAKGYPTSLDHFIATGKYQSHFAGAYGEKPDRLLITFPSDDPSQVCNHRYEMRDSQGKRLAYSDGEEYAVYSTKDEEYHITNISERPDVHEWVKDYFKQEWREVLTLRFLLPQVRGVIGLWQFDTSGVDTSIPSIVSMFDFVKTQAGTVINVPFDLTVSMQKSQRPDSKSRFPVVDLICNVSSESLEKLHEVKIENMRTGLLTEKKIEALGYNGEFYEEEE